MNAAETEGGLLMACPTTQNLKLKKSRNCVLCSEDKVLMHFKIRRILKLNLSIEAVQ